MWMTVRRPMYMWMTVSAQNTVGDLNIIWGHEDVIWVQDYWDKNTKTVITNINYFTCDYKYINRAPHRSGLYWYGAIIQ